MSSDISKSSILARLSREENEDKFVEKDVERCLDDLWREREIYRMARSLMFFLGEARKSCLQSIPADVAILVGQEHLVAA